MLVYGHNGLIFKPLDNETSLLKQKEISCAPNFPTSSQHDSWRIQHFYWTSASKFSCVFWFIELLVEHTTVSFNCIFDLHIRSHRPVIGGMNHTSRLSPSVNRKKCVSSFVSCTLYSSYHEWLSMPFFYKFSNHLTCVFLSNKLKIVILHFPFSLDLWL